MSSPILLTADAPDIEEILEADRALEKHFKSITKVNADLDRATVSFQSNKITPLHRWYKYKEAFSARLVEYFLQLYRVDGPVLDPFAGIGTTLFTSASAGLDTTGIELLPIGRFIIHARETLQENYTDQDFKTLRQIALSQPWKKTKPTYHLNELRITQGAYPPETRDLLERYRTYADTQEEKVKEILVFALLCILENISYTRKDGQYLRWDYRSGRRSGGKKFDKGNILSFNEAVSQKLTEICDDCLSPVSQQNLFYTEPEKTGNLKLISGSCLNELLNLGSNQYAATITSPPYCNRYDYTRTYALELALLGCTEKDVLDLRQEMLSCTVENREKNLLAISPSWKLPVEACENHTLLQKILSQLRALKAKGELNNNGIPRMVQGYFYEMACVIFELHRVTRLGGRVIMVNDNVRYAGIPVSVDFILSDIAEKAGFEVEEIMLLPTGKGNSSQQMGAHGRQPLRKCVYVWRKSS